MKKITFLLVFLILILGGSWAIMRFAPQTLEKIPFSIPGLTKTSAPQTPVSPAEYQAWRDSLDQMDLLIHDEVDPQRLSMLKSKQSYYWKRLQSVRTNLEQQKPSEDAQLGTTKPMSDKELINFLIKVLSIAAGVLLLLILILYLFLRRKRKALTRKLNAIQTEDDRFAGPRDGHTSKAPERPIPPAPLNSPPTAGLDLSQFQIETPKRRENPRPEIPPADISRTEFPTSSPQLLRPTAKQRITMALQGLADVLGTSPNNPTQQSPRPRPTPPTPAPRAPSPNVFRPTHSNPLVPPTPPPSQDDTEEVLKLARRGFTPLEIARRLRMPQDKVEMIVRFHRE